MLDREYNRMLGILRRAVRSWQLSNGPPRPGIDLRPHIRASRQRHWQSACYRPLAWLRWDEGYGDATPCRLTAEGLRVVQEARAAGLVDDFGRPLAGQESKAAYKRRKLAEACARQAA